MEAPVEQRGPRRRNFAAAAGSIWGLATYGVLWEGTPVEATRPFVESAVGTLVLLPSRIVIWAILGAESALGRTFDLSTNYSWIAPASALVGALLAAGIFTIAWRAARLTRR